MAERIASLLASGTEILYGLGLGDRVVAISHECDFPERARAKPRVTRSRIDAGASSANIDDQVKAISSTGRSLFEIDTERLTALRPDLIVTQSHCDVCAVSYDDVCALLAQSDALRATTIVDLNPVRLNDLFTDVRRVAQSAGAEAAGEAYVHTLRTRTDAVEQKTRDLPNSARPRTVFIEWSDPVMVAGNWMPDLVAMAGGENGMTTPGARSAYTNWDEVLDYNPDVVVVGPCGFDLDRSIVEAHALARRRGWTSLSAVTHGRVYAVDGNALFNRSGPRLIDSLEVLASMLCPDLFGDAHRLYPASVHRCQDVA